MKFNASYSKEEFKQLLKEHPNDLGYYTCPVDGDFYDTYVYSDEDQRVPEFVRVDSDYGILEVDAVEHMQLDNVGFFVKSNYDQIDSIEDEAIDRVWFDRSDPNTDRTDILAAQERVMEKWNIDPAECDDFYHGYWSGILALCRYLHLGNDVNIEDLRSGNGLLYT